KPYNKNVSVQRIFSHIKFAKDAFDYINSLVKEPEIIYVVLPPNSLAKNAIEYKQNHNVKIIFDIMDLWPEAYTMGNSKLNLLLNTWRKLRSSSLSKADFIITECNYFQKSIAQELNSVKNDTLYLSKPDSGTEIKPVLSEKNFDILYLGSINTIIDIDIIVDFLFELNSKKKVIFHIIGDGESREKLIKQLSKFNIDYIYHGVIYDSFKKQEIIDKCHFGMNIMQENIAVGLTMKSIDYFQFGLPIINNIKEDTEAIVKNNRIGFNIRKENISTVVDEIHGLTNEQIKEMKYTSVKVFENLFSYDSFTKKMDNIFSKI
ncbi:hypothetical protein, partial [Klebsiella pneumoniae]|uniref:hypothetical protein n=1 Tax=Klebsiella pneumoniae TaxID=573 RepID=UPI001486D2A4